MGKVKKYLLDDGTYTDAHEVAARTKITLQAARTRLSISADPKKIWKLKRVARENNTESYKVRCIKEREVSIYNEMYRLVFKTI